MTRELREMKSGAWACIAMFAGCIVVWAFIIYLIFQWT